MTQPQSTNPVSRWFRKLTGGSAPVRTAPSEASTPIASCRDRQMVEVRGEITQVTPEVGDGYRRLVAELSDPSGSVRLIWLSRDRIAGIEVGRRLRVVGRIARIDERATMFNPRYELRS